MSKKEKFALYLTPEKKARLERRYQEDGSRSITGFIERAIDFYLDYLSANDAGLFLPTSIQSYLDGRVGQLESKMASLAYKQAVELDMAVMMLTMGAQAVDTLSSKVISPSRIVSASWMTAFLIWRNSFCRDSGGRCRSFSE